MRYVLGIDFDGVIHAYRRGDCGPVIYDTPTPGAAAALEAYRSVFDVQIVSARAKTAEGREAITAWMRTHGLPPLPASDRKPAGELLVTLDDRAWLFRGTWPSAQALQQFRPWWQLGRL